jgi:hypothetical protein
MALHSADNRRPIEILAIVLIGAVATAGCGGPSSPAASDPQLRAAMTLLGQQYGGYLGAHNGTAPKDLVEFHEHVESQLPILADFGVKSADDLLRAGRDGKQLEVVTGATISMPDNPEYALAAYEQSAVDGRRFACDSRGGVHDLTTEEFTEKFPGK